MVRFPNREKRDIYQTVDGFAFGWKSLKTNSANPATNEKNLRSRKNASGFVSILRECKFLILNYFCHFFALISENLY
jgi:hypothetical protein